MWKSILFFDSRGYETAFCRLDETGIYREIIPDSEDIICSRVLSGFQFRINDLYRQPAITELVGDSVYQSYVMTEYQAEKRKAESEKKRAEREKQKAESEKKRAEREKRKAESEKQWAEQEKRKTEKLSEKLRNLGIPEEEIEKLCRE